MPRKRGPCAEWPNCECPKCERYRVRLDNIRGLNGDPRTGNSTRVIGACHYCGNEATTRDHKTPKSKGGRGVDNIVPACVPCNRDKGAMGYEDYMALRKRRVSI